MKRFHTQTWKSPASTAMKTSITAATYLLLIMFALTGCAATETALSDNSSSPAGGNETSDTQFVELLKQLNSKNPVTEAQSTIAAGKPYFLCNIGRSQTVPGLEVEEYTSAREKCSTQCLDGVTDAVLGENHLRYLQAATAYSASWNKVMINVCRQEAVRQ